MKSYFNGENPNMEEIPVRLLGSEFQLSVLNIIKKIPYGKTMTYGEISDIIAKTRGIKRMSSRAVGWAIAHNPISIIIPCHRVIGKGGKITGYAGGIDRKIKLLELEGILVK